jgi:hypothetical protein
LSLAFRPLTVRAPAAIDPPLSPWLAALKRESSFKASNALRNEGCLRLWQNKDRSWEMTLMHYRTQHVWRPWLSRAAGSGVLLVALGLLVLGTLAVALVMVIGTLMALLAIGLGALTGRPVLRRSQQVPPTDTPTGRVLEGEYRVLDTRRHGNPRQDSPRN